MRPIRLELEGFTAYREYTVLDFEGADLFVLTGPTGSGKSSIIDAITFALYGSVSRYQNPNLVHPVISQGKVEAKVRFDFAVDDRLYTVVRVVRKTPRGGATTKEARLESGGQLLAGTADDITRKMRAMLGLNFEQFTTCVVLPQGEFARFLHEKPAQRQDLLTKLLGVDMYEKMGNLARTREAVAKQKAQILGEELEGLRHATASAKKAAASRVRELDALKQAVEEAAPELENLDAAIAAKNTDAERLTGEAELLESVRIPNGLTELDARIEKARARLASARKARTEAENAVSAAEREASKLPVATELEEMLRTHERRDERKRGLEKARGDVAAARQRLDRADRERRKSVERVKAARAAADHARRELAAHDLASHLNAGEACPVCRRVLDRAPALSLPPALADAERELIAAEKEHGERERALRDAEKSLALAEERTRSLENELDALDQKLENAPEPSRVKQQIEEVDRFEAALAASRKAARLAGEEERRAEEKLERTSDEEASAWKRFEEARDGVTAFGPPATDREALGAAWRKLADWAKARAPRHRELARAAGAEARSAVERKSKRIEEIQKKARDVGIEIDDERPRDGVVSALAEAVQEKKRIVEAMERARVLRGKLEAEKETAVVAGALGNHLKATGFERWLLEEAFRRLVSRATEILNELSSGQYSFEYDEKLNFEVVDHRNADEQRSARTLSGGETFLASLALALTLAEQTAELAAGGSARLESLFLDEGFGTLDDDTLEIVASAIEDLGARGRIVGLVTHQQSLADKIAVQFRVNKGPVTATVEKTVA